MRDNFEAALAKVLAHEGGYVNHPKDPGGATNKGVTQGVYDGYRKRRGFPPRSVRMITTSEVAEIYRLQYWNAVRADELPPGIDYVVFDGAVNSGPKQSILWLQRSLGVKPDGHMGEATLDAVRENPNHDALIEEICRRRMAFLRALKPFPTFGAGWTSRVAGVLRVGQAMASGRQPPQLGGSGGGARAMADDIGEPSDGVRDFADASIGGGSVTTLLSTTTTALEPVKDASPAIQNLILFLIIAGIIATLVGFAVRYWQGRKRSTARSAQNGEAIAPADEFAWSA